MKDKQLIDRSATVAANVLFELGYINEDTFSEVIKKHHGEKFKKKKDAVSRPYIDHIRQSNGL